MVGFVDEFVEARMMEEPGEGKGGRGGEGRGGEGRKSIPQLCPGEGINLWFYWVN